MLVVPTAGRRLFSPSTRENGVLVTHKISGRIVGRLKGISVWQARNAGSCELDDLPTSTYSGNHLAIACGLRLRTKIHTSSRSMGHTITIVTIQPHLERAVPAIGA